MNQALLALLALAVAVWFAFQSQRNEIVLDLQRVQNEVEVLATAAGLDVLGQAGRLPFDAGVADSAGVVSDTSALTAAPFEGGRHFQLAGDLDDLHGMQPLTYLNAEHQVSFTITAEVEYVRTDDLATPAPGRSFAKAVHLTVAHSQLAEPIELTQVFTYP